MKQVPPTEFELSTACPQPAPPAERPATLLEDLRRPRLLIRAARFGLADYDRSRDLKRLLGGDLPTPGRAFGRLKEAEEQLDTARRGGATAYSPARHVEVLIALIAEALILRRTRNEDPDA